ncbi:hypothetical protein WX45_02713 [Clostridium ljungdahlii DSM 13528]|uniref:Uncharacterized protein n=1 Tax=Clostridium ljungdahlii (strain ATCC 55383 / DSM 13528 / PETC) TaxID=748727 RepID=A0ABX2TXC5_CLOLD|nr:hypothetical protein WX45_02713 [Clostridium ljungdahlii DSM 13528]
MTVKRKSVKNTAAHRYCMEDETLTMSLELCFREDREVR